VNIPAPESIAMVALDRRDFGALRTIIRELSGINLSDAKQTLVTSRLQRRLRALGLRSFGDYLAHVRSDASGAEQRELVNAITTNKTSFFRESHHFDFLANVIVPEIVARARSGGSKRIRIWSAACSTGQEPWSIAIALQQSLGLKSDWDIRILASDLDTDVLRAAEDATYSADAIAEVPRLYRDDAFVRGPGGTFQIAPELRKLVTFRQLNLVDRAWPIRVQFDAIFCRNVAIYFDRPTQKTLFEGLARHLTPNGYLFSGHSENLHWLGDTLVPAGNTVHRLAGSAPRSASKIGAALPHRLQALPPPQVAIRAGDVRASAKPVVIRTLLGSCVAACLYDPLKRIGGMNHFMLPSGESPTRAAACFGIQAMELLINDLMKLGADRGRLVAKIFGASELRAESTIARDNAAFAVSFLEGEGIAIVARKLGARLPLAVKFDTDTGIARVREVERTNEVARDEGSYLEKLARRRQEGAELSDGVTFFGSGR
jgi:chemotaxis protein methyltransferase CheR